MLSGKVFILIILVTITLSINLVQATNCTCVEGDHCCCPSGWTCCNYPGRCCCQSPFGEVYQSHAHQFVPTQTLEEKQSESKLDTSIHCNTDCFFGQVCGGYCECIWPNCVEKRIENQLMEKTKNRQVSCKPLMADCRSAQDCCSNYCGAFNWCSTGPLESK
ncbi:hypothetical protein ABPG72_012980 [Tetrahymena utriculariae]